MVYGYSWELLSWAIITLYMSYALNRVRGFWDVSFLVIFFTETAFDIVYIYIRSTRVCVCATHCNTLQHTFIVDT